MKNSLHQVISGVRNHPLVSRAFRFKDRRTIPLKAETLVFSTHCVLFARPCTNKEKHLKSLAFTVFTSYMCTLHIVHVSVLVELKTFLEDIKLTHLPAAEGLYERERQVLEILHGSFHFFLHNCNLKGGESIKELCAGFHWIGNPFSQNRTCFSTKQSNLLEKIESQIALTP